jgi:hypothetical protein
MSEINVRDFFQGRLGFVLRAYGVPSGVKHLPARIFVGLGRCCFGTFWVLKLGCQAVDLSRDLFNCVCLPLLRNVRQPFSWEMKE